MDIDGYRSEIRDLFYKMEESKSAHPDKTIGYCNKLEAYGKEIQDDALVGYICFVKGEFYYQNNDMQNFYREMLTCLQPLEKAHEWAYVVMANNMLGIMSLNRGNAPFAMDYYIKALDICRKYRLLDLEWVVHMNMGTLYLNVDDESNALLHLEEGYNYIREHSYEAGYLINLTAACVNIGKAYLAMDDLLSAEEYWKKLENKCLPHINDADKVAVYCFGARFYNKIGEYEERERCIQALDDMITKSTIAIMDVFDDISEYLMMLLDIKNKKEFAKTWVEMYELTKKTTVLDMERRLLELQLSYYTVYREEDAYAAAVIEYARVCMAESKERKLMVSNMIELRTSLQDLTTINHKVEKENEILQKRSETDPLTGLYNRFALNDYWDKTFERAYHEKKDVAIEILDIDYFKEYNDNYGHQAGDRCLTTISDCMKAIMRRGGIFCARYGGDEFVIIYEGYNEKEVSEIVAELTQRIAEESLEHKYSKVADRVTISQGVCCGIPSGTEKAFDYLHSADVMLYQVKEAGKNGMRIGKCIEWGK